MASTKKKQTELPGTQSPDDIDTVDDLMADFMNKKEECALEKKVLKRMEEQRDAIQHKVIELLRQHKRKVYVYRDGVMSWKVRVADKSKLVFTRDHDKAAEEVRPKRARKTPAVG